MSGANVDDVFDRVETKVKGLLGENAQLREQNRVLREALQRERDFFETAAATANRMRVDTERALDAEREKVKAHERAYQEGHPSPCTLGSLCPYCEIERRVEQLSQLQALVRALPSFHVVCSQQKWYLRISGYFCSISEDEAMAWNRFMQYRATLDATTPAADTSIIGKCEPPSQWNRNAQVRGDIS